MAEAGGCNFTPSLGVILHPPMGCNFTPSLFSIYSDFPKLQKNGNN